MKAALVSGQPSTKGGGTAEPVLYPSLSLPPLHSPVRSFSSSSCAATVTASASLPPSLPLLPSLPATKHAGDRRCRLVPSPLSKAQQPRRAASDWVFCISRTILRLQPAVTYPIDWLSCGTRRNQASSRSTVCREGLEVAFFLQQGREKPAFQDARRDRVLVIPAPVVELHAPCSSAAGEVVDA